MAKRIFLVAICVVLAIAGVAGYRTLTLVRPQLPAAAALPPGVSADSVAQHLGAAIRFQTINFGNGINADTRNQQIDALRDWLAQTYPAFHQAAQRQSFDHSLLFTWPGSDANLPPLLVMAHMDVVPVVAGSETAWQHRPFSGDVAEGYVWGRGAIDDKGPLIRLLEAAEQLAAAHYAPRRTILFAFGEDEESGGRGGNAIIANTLAQRGVHPYLVVDEGGIILNHMLPGVAQPIALLAVGEKGYLSLQLVAHGQGGHSSQPARDLAIDHLARALTALEDHPFPLRFGAVEREQLHTIAPYARTWQRVALANLWLSGPLVMHSLAATPAGAATLHTSTAPTMLSAGIKDNVIPPTASAVVNFRLQPGDTIAGVEAHARQAIADPGVDVNALTETQSEPSRLVSTGSAAWHSVGEIVRTRFGVPVAPYILSGATDSRHYLPIAGDVLRFDPFHFEPTDLERIHGNNERVAVGDLAPAVGFYMDVLRLAAAPAPK